jgi:hypothetical protein
MADDIVGRRIGRKIKPTIHKFSPRIAYPGSIIEIHGENFGIRTTDEVTIGGKQALIIERSPTKIRAITDRSTISGPVKVKTGSQIATSSYEFKALEYPQPGSNTDGPPIYFAGMGRGQDAGDVPSTGTLNLLVVLVNPSDKVPANAANTRNTVVQAWNNVHTFYDQASYTRLNVQVDVINNWHTLLDDFNHYVSLSASDIYAPNIRPDALDQLMAEAAQFAVNDGYNLDNYDVMVCQINLNNTFIRALGGWSKSNFFYFRINSWFPPDFTLINVTVNHELNLLAIQESANWGRCAHELGHNIVSVPSSVTASPGSATLIEDVYSSDLIDPGVATAASFEMMGSHDSHPLFSAYNMEKMGYYNGTNILNLQWDRNAFSQEYEVVAHGATENNLGARYHLIKIRVTDGLYYYIEVRQRPGTTTQIFDENIPLNGAPQQGGVIVTKVLTDQMNMNQQMRFITLMHDTHVLKNGDVATDPARALEITVINDNVVNRPLVCRVRVAWAQGIADDPNGAFDLRVEPWDSNWQTPDIWIDRITYGVYDQPLDAQGRPQGNGDKPRPMEINHFWGRVHCDGSVGVTNVRLTYYVVEPPGVGDNGNWAPLRTVVIPNINANSFSDVNTNWTPVVNRHTCMKVWAEQQLGEITGGNNLAQENVFQFEAPAASIPAPVSMDVAVRNPLKDKTIVFMSIKGVPEGFSVHFPHAWLWLDPLEERKFHLTIVPTLDYPDYSKKEIQRANVRLVGDIPRNYTKEILPGVLPGSRMFAIGGITAQVTPKRRVDINIKEDPESAKKDSIIAINGSISPGLSNQRLRVDLTDPLDRTRAVEVKTSTQGTFSAKFDLKRMPSLDSKQQKTEREKQVSGVYIAQAFIINSPNAAEAESNILQIKK